MFKEKRMRHPRGGFTLVEMLVVLGIIGLLAGALIGSFAHLKTTARQTQAQTLVGEVNTALSLYLQRYGKWPDELMKGENGGSAPTRMEMDTEACWVLQNKKLLDVIVKVWSDSAQEWKWVSEKDGGSLDRFGLMDPWGRAALKRNPSISGADSKVEGGVQLSDHRIQYRLDVNYDGYVDSEEGSPFGLKVRASALVWSRGPDGKDDFQDKNKPYPRDDRLSWNYGGSRK